MKKHSMIIWLSSLEWDIDRFKDDIGLGNDTWVRAKLYNVKNKIVDFWISTRAL